MKNNLIFYSNDYIEQLTCQFKNPHSPLMGGIFIIYNFIQIYLICGLILVLVWLYEAYKSGLVKSISLNVYNELDAIQSHNYQIKKFMRQMVVSKQLSETHAPLLEFLWTIFPIIILMFIAYPSFALLYALDETISPLFNITVIGNQWFWTYEYNDFNIHEILLDYLSSNPDFIQAWEQYELCYRSMLSQYKLLVTIENVMYWREAADAFKSLDQIISEIPVHISVDCNNLNEDSLPFGYPRLLSTDNVLVIPAKTPIRFLITSNDVIHSWSVPNFGIKVDAVPGRINQAFLVTDFCGTSWGQCSELCGVNHGYMPIEVRVLPLDEFLFYLKVKFREIERDNDIIENVISTIIKFLLAYRRFSSSLIETYNDDSE